MTTPDDKHPPKPEAVYFFGTCLVDQFSPQAGLDAVRILEREGIRVIFPEDQTCCGQPAYTSGFPDQARAVASQQISLFPEPWPVVIPSGSCAGMMHHHYARLFADDPAMLARAEALSKRIYEFTEFLIHVLDYRPKDCGAACTVALHTSCSARREMDTLNTGRELLARLEHVKLARHGHESECCGFGGTFSVRHPDISGAMVRDKLAALQGSGATTVVSADCGCLLNITSHAQHAAADNTALQGEHIATFLWQRTGG